MNNNKPTRTELKNYIQHLEKLLFAVTGEGINADVSMQLVSENLPIHYKSTLAKKTALILYSQNPEQEGLYESIKKKFKN